VDLLQLGQRRSAENQQRAGTLALRPCRVDVVQPSDPRGSSSDAEKKQNISFIEQSLARGHYSVLKIATTT